MVISIEPTGTGSYQVVLTNPNTATETERAYRYIGAAFEANEDSDGYGRALADAGHWERLFRQAGIPVEMAVVTRL